MFYNFEDSAWDSALGIDGYNSRDPSNDKRVLSSNLTYYYYTR